MSAVEQLAARGRRRRGVDSSSYARQQQEARRALYHCNYCHRDISSSIRIKCAVCQDFDLCLTCFSVGVELSGHRSNHSYRVIDNLGFPLLHPDWGADEELLLLEGVDHCGLGNWLAVSEHVGTKKPDQCQQHYYQTYIEPDSCPLPTIAPELQGVDLAALAAAYKEGRQRKRPASCMQQGADKPPSAAEAAAASQQQPLPGGGKGGSSWPGLDNSGLGEMMSGSDGIGGLVKLEGGVQTMSEADRDMEQQQQQQQGTAGLGQQATKRSRTAQEPGAAAAAPPHSTQAGASQQGGGLGLSLSRGWAAEDGQQGAAGGGGEGGEEHTRVRGSGPQLDAATGWHAKRQEFDPEWDNDAETAIAEIEFRPDDTPHETAMKLRDMEIYNKRLDERERRREFIVKYGLLNVRRVHGQERKRLPAEKEQYTKLRVFARFQPPGAHEAFLSGLFTEGRLRNCIRELQAYRAAGLRTFAEVEEWQQARHKADKAASKAAGASGAAAASAAAVDEIFSGSGYKNPSAALHAWRQRRGVGLDLSGLPGLEALSSKERELCTALRLLPAHYLVLKDHLMRHGDTHGYLSRQDARSAVRLEKGKAVKVYELLMSSGWLPQAPGGPADSARGGSHDTGASASEDEGEEQQPWQQQQQNQQPGPEKAQQQGAPQGAGTTPAAEAPTA